MPSLHLDLRCAPIYTGTMTDTTDDDIPAEAPGGATSSEPLSRAISERYLTYALSTIMHRALPDA